jgi:hypothetical protein
MLLYDAYEPGLAAGGYRLVLQQTVQLKQEDAEPSHHYYREQRFVVQGPRFFIGPDEIHACYPPPSSEGRFDNVLPHMVLRKRSLPWERKLNAPASERPIPWLALLVLGEDALAAAGARGAPKTVLPRTLVRPKEEDSNTRIRCRREDGQALLLPDLAEEAPEELAASGPDETKLLVKVIDLPLKLFLELCPPLEDLPFLAHLRHVNTQGKAPLQMHAEGQFSVLVANRLPQDGVNVVHLVSLEGWEALLGPRESLPAFTAPEGSSPEALKVRLVTLGSWRFTHDRKNAFSFGSVMRSLKRGTFGSQPDTPTSTAAVDDVLVRGYVPVEYRGQSGDTAFAWYRGPLAALEVPPLKDLKPHYGRPEFEALVDEVTGVPDLSYASAWQLGRLLALASPLFSSGIRTFFNKTPCGSALEAARRLDNYLATHRDNLFSSRKAGSDEDPAVARNRPDMVASLVDWLARLVLLQPVPFDYLVADQRLLPEESLRFFHIDNNWVEALATGALSIAVRGVPTRGEEKGEAGEARSIREALSRLVYQDRLRQQGRSFVEHPPGDFMDQVKSGFLLRSVAILGWPGLEVKVEADATGRAAGAGDTEGFGKGLRMERLASDLLLCVVSGHLNRVTFTEPPEGLRFGVDALSKSLRRGTSGVLAIKDLAVKLGGPKPGPAALALQMILPPERQTLHWTSQT